MGLNKRKRVYRWWVGWEPEKTERWIEAMEAEGWHLTRISLNAIRFDFEKGEPRKMRYGIDFQNTQDPSYKEIFSDTGWELIYSGAGWYVWRMPYTEKRPEIYTDVLSLIERNKRLMSVLVFALIAQFPLIVLNVPRFINFHNYYALWVIYFLLIGLLGYGSYRLIMINQKLKNKLK
ncbi:MAG: DUF2812 domain-containing protein [Candidatus Pristimantibacillus sp.]